AGRHCTLTAAHCFRSGFGSYTPVHKVERCLNISFGGVFVDTPVVLSAGAQALFFLALYTDVNGKHTKVFVAQLSDIGVSPSAVLIENSLFSDELCNGVITGFGGKQT